MTVTTAINTRYSYLDKDTLRNRKPNSASREREAVVTVTLTAESPDATTGTFDVNFGGVAGGFVEVYYAKVVQASTGLTPYAFNYIPGADRVATGTIEVRNLSDGALATAALTGTLVIEIRGA